MRTIALGAPLGQHARHHRIALLGAAHGFHDVAEIGGVQIAEKRHETSIDLA